MSWIVSTKEVHEGLITLRDKSLKDARFDRTVAFSHVISMLADMLEEEEKETNK